MPFTVTKLIKRMKNLIYILFTLTLITGCGQKQTSVISDEHRHQKGEVYTCPMHSQIVSEKPGKCPVCSMDLVKKTSQTSTDEQLINLTPNQILLANIKTETINPSKTASKSTFFTGKIVFDPLNKESVNARSEGRITRLYVKETGETIQAGQKLFDVYSEELLATQQEFLVAIKEAEILKSASVNWSVQIERIKRKLYLLGLTPAQVKAIQASKKTFQYHTIYSKTSGIIVEKFKNEGDYLKEGDAVFEISKNNSFWLETEVYDNERNFINPDKNYDIYIEGFPNAAFKGRLAFNNENLQGNSRLNILSFKIQNSSNKLVPGMPAKIKIDVQNPDSQSRSIPTGAIIFDEKENYVWIMAENNHFKRKTVKLGEQKGIFTTITSGLENTDRVVTSGAYLLNSEFKLRFGY